MSTASPRLAVFVCAVCLALGGCTTLKDPAGRTAAAMTPARAYDVWDQVIAAHVDAQGRVDFSALARAPAALDRFVGWVYRVAPANRPDWFSTRAAVLAYHLNAYNALTMYSVLQLGIPKKLGAFDRLRFFVLRKIRVGGQRMSLYAYENDVIRVLGDPRVHFALNCMAVSCPRLPRTAFRPADVDAALDRAAREFCNSPKYVAVNRDNQTVRLSAIFDFYPKDFLAKAPSLIAYVNRYRDRPIASADPIRFMAYDWTINRQPGG